MISIHSQPEPREFEEIPAIRRQNERGDSIHSQPERAREFEEIPAICRQNQRGDSSQNDRGDFSLIDFSNRLYFGGGKSNRFQ